MDNKERRPSKLSVQFNDLFDGIPRQISEAQPVFLDGEKEALPRRLSVTAKPRWRAFSNFFKAIPKKQTEEEPLVEKEIEEEEIEYKTHWVSIWLATLMCFFAALTFTLFMPVLWPFLHEIDPKSKESFIGYVVAIYSIGQAIASPLVGYLSNRMQQTRIPVAICVSVMILSNLIYCCIEAFPMTSRKWILFFVRFLCGIGSGVVALLRSYAAMASAPHDRVRAITLVTGAFSLGLVIGPGAQAAFGPIGYPGLVLGPFHLDIYTAAAFFSVVINLALLICLFVFFKESYAGLVPEEHLQSLPPIDVISVSVCFFTRFLLMFALTNLEAVQSAYTMAMYAWTNEQAATYNSLILAAAGVIGFFIYAAFVIRKDLMNERIAVVIGNVLFFLFHVFTYPWPFFHGKLKYQQAISPDQTMIDFSNDSSIVDPEYQNTGCHPEMDWCATTPQVPLWLFIVIRVIFVGIAFPLMNAPNTALFSKVLGPRRQGTMQGFLMLSGCFARTLAPILMMNLFQTEGPKIIWIIEAAMFLVGFVPWVVFWKNMVPLQYTIRKKSDYESVD